MNDDYGEGPIKSLLDLRHSLMKNLRIKVGMGDIRNGAELQSEAERVLARLAADKDAQLAAVIGVHVEIFQDDEFDLSWQLHFVPRSAVDLLGTIL